MASQLQIVAADDPPPPLATFRADARLRLWAAGGCALCSLAFTALGYRRSLQPVIAGPLAAAFLLWAAYLLTTFAARVAVRYTLTASRLEIEKGFLGKRFESIELWRVRDLVLEQTLVERVRGVGRITVVSSDPLEPNLEIGPAAGARRLYEELRDAVAAARKSARVVPLA
jgi:membrane protein YdbS with pleckstrin-like domain